MVVSLRRGAWSVPRNHPEQASRKRRRGQARIRHPPRARWSADSWPCRAPWTRADRASQRSPWPAAPPPMPAGWPPTAKLRRAPRGPNSPNARLALVLDALPPGAGPANRVRSLAIRTWSPRPSSPQPLHRVNPSRAIG